MTERVLLCVRLSRLTDATTSPERQLEDMRKLVRQRDYTEVGVVEDLDVSATLTGPFERAALREWIGDGKGDHGRMHEIDVFVVWRVDRMVRSMFDTVDLIRWCREHEVLLVSATEPFLDMDAPGGEFGFLALSWAAQMESAANSVRSSSAYQHNIRSGKYRGGPVPWGYLPDKSSGEWRYVQDPEQAKVIREVVARVLDGELIQHIADDLTRREVPTSQDRFAKFKGREPQGRRWQHTSLKHCLKSPTLLGYTVARMPVVGEGGKQKRGARGQKILGDWTVVRNDDGSPLVKAEPILTREVFDRLQVELAKRQAHKEPNKNTTALLLRVLYCGACDNPMYRHVGGAKPDRHRYRCSSPQLGEQCGNGSVLVVEADTFVSENLLDMLGDSDRLERVWDSGSDHSAELAELDATLADLTGLVGTGPYRAGTAQRITLDNRIEQLAARQAELAAAEVRPASWAWRPTGEKFADWWEAQDVQGKNMWLRSMGIRVTFDSSSGAPVWSVDFGDLERFEEQLQFGESATAAVRRVVEHEE